jgi:hypothetical protein
MAFTYDDDLGDNVSIVRFLLQDTTAPGLFSDGELTWLISAEANVYLAAAIAAETQAAKQRGLQKKRVGELELVYSSERWEAVAKRLRLRGSTHQIISAGGIDVDERDAFWDDDSLIKPEFFSEVHYDSTSLLPSATRSSDDGDD